MKKLLLTLSLAFFSTNALAEWSKIDESDDNGGYTVYADLSTIHKANDRVKMWTLIDYAIEQEEAGADFLSKEIRRKYDCKGKHIRILAFKLFSWNMGQGQLVRSYSQPQKWERVQPGSMDEAEWKVACGE